MFETIQKYMKKPELYAPGTARFWDDEHISKSMLKAHLTPDLDSATRSLPFVRRSAAWIAGIAPADLYPRLLDLGCGPGIYAEQFDTAGYQVTGIDLSKRSISYARESARSGGRQITYHTGNYLTMKYSQQFDAAVLIYCDLGALSTGDRALLLKNTAAALRSGGLLIFDVFTPHQYLGQQEDRTWEYCDSGFWSRDPYLCLNSMYRYEDCNTFLRQYIVIGQCRVNCYNIWDHTFTADELRQDLESAGLKIQGIYNDIAGSPVSDEGRQMCVVAVKQS